MVPTNPAHAAFEIPKTMVMRDGKIKPIYMIKDIEVHKAKKLWAGNSGYYLTGIQVSQRHDPVAGIVTGMPIRTSLLVRADFKQGLFETMNSVYVDADINPECKILEVQVDEADG